MTASKPRTKSLSCPQGRLRRPKPADALSAFLVDVPRSTDRCAAAQTRISLWWRVLAQQDLSDKRDSRSAHPLQPRLHARRDCRQDFLALAGLAQALIKAQGFFA